MGEIRIERLNRRDAGVVITHLDVSTQKRAMLERRRALEELHHLNRVSTVGQLAGSIAHELAQPLASILSNSQAAFRFLDRANPELGEVRAALTEIVDEDRRARSIIGRLRAILKKQTVPVQAVDLNKTVHEVTRLIQNVLLMRGIQLRLDLDSQAPVVQADPVSLQQVLLNLLNNGMDAVSGLPRSNRNLIVRTAVGGRTANVVVEDNGPGVPGPLKKKLFESFYTTKPDGLGMGLSISRSLVEALQGQITFENIPGGGARFQVALPTAAATGQPEKAKAASQSLA